jgi:hypothetical protein
MTRHPFSLLGIAFAVALVLAPDVRADLFAPGATLDVTYTDPATSSQSTQTVPFNPGGAPASLDGGALQISVQTLVVNSTTEWVQFNLQTTNGGKLDTQSGGYFLVNLNNVKLTEAAGWISNFYAFTYNGVASGDPFFGTLFTDPVTPSAGKVEGASYPLLTFSPFYGTVFFPSPPATLNVEQTPYGYYLNIWGVNPNANGFLAGMELQAAQPFPTTTVPEPTTLACFTASLLGLAGGAWWRRQRRAG